MNKNIIVIEQQHLSSISQKLGLSELKTRDFQIGDKTFSRVTTSANINSFSMQEHITNGHTAGFFNSEICNPSAIFFDMDATVIAEESLVEIAKATGKEAEIEAITKRAMEGGLEFKESLAQRLAILKGLKRETLAHIKETINPGFPELASWCHQKNIPIFLISGGFVEIAEPVAKKFNFKAFKANQFAWQNNIMLGHASGDIVDAEGKRLAVNHWCKQFGIDPKQCIAVGDGANDLPMMKLCGLAVGHSPKKILWKNLNISNHTGNHKFLLECLIP